VIHIYVEGGGDAGSTKAACREAFATLFAGIPIPENAFRVIASGGRLRAYQNFCDALQRHRNAVVLLLVDSERLVPANTAPWAHLGADPENWERPEGTTDEQAHLMVQAMEAWFFADPEMLATFYGQRFLSNSLPRRQNIEEIPKTDLVPALEHASRNTTKGTYHKTQHGFAILKSIRPVKIRNRSAYANRLFDLLERETRPEN
jgi:hypothetical protein